MGSSAANEKLDDETFASIHADLPTKMTGGGNGILVVDSAVFK